MTLIFQRLYSLYYIQSGDIAKGHIKKILPEVLALFINVICDLCVPQVSQRLLPLLTYWPGNACYASLSQSLVTSPLFASKASQSHSPASVHL